MLKDDQFYIDVICHDTLFHHSRHGQSILYILDHPLCNLDLCSPLEISSYLLCESQVHFLLSERKKIFNETANTTSMN
jgi:hypothetical protein